MQTFKDNAGRTWTVVVNVDAVKRVRTLLGLNLAASNFQETLQKILDDPVLLCDVIYVICKPDADVAKVSDEEFGRSMAGDAIDLATKALLEELANFTPNPRDRARVQRVLKTLFQLAEIKRDSAAEALDQACESVLKDQEKQTYGRSSGSSPESSESTQGS